MIERKSWEEFKKTGLLWFINTTLHMFGWAIVCEVRDKKVIETYPARVKFRGFSEEVTEEGYKKVTEYLEKNIKELRQETEDED